MRILYIFPHPDDESFGPAGAIAAQIRAGHEVHLLTLTRGGATQQRHKLGLSVGEMGEVRAEELRRAAESLGVRSLKILGYPDSGLAEIDPRLLEAEVEQHTLALQPSLLVTYPVHGGTGYHDHLVTHAVVKRVYLAMRDERLVHARRLAFFTLPDSGASGFQPDGWPRLKLSDPDRIDCIVPLEPEDIDAMRQALSCYPTYREIIERTDVLARIGDRVHFEIFGEDFSPPLEDLTARLP